MNTGILSIKLSQEAKQWDNMVTKLYQFLAETDEDRQKAFTKNEEDKEKIEKEKIEKRLQAEADKHGKTLEELKQREQDRKDAEDKEALQKKSKVKDYESGFNKNKMEDLLRAKKHAQKTFDAEEKELIACAFKGRLQELVDGISKVNHLIKKSKFDSYSDELERFKKGLLENFVEEALTMRMVLQNLCIKISGHPMGLMFFYKLKADIYRYLSQYQSYFTVVAKEHNAISAMKDKTDEERKKKRQAYCDDKVMIFLSVYYGDHIMIKTDDSVKDIKHKTDHREAKYNFTKKANSNYKKALFIEEYYKSKVLQRQDQLKSSNGYVGPDDGYKITSLSLAITLNYSVFVWGIKKEAKRALRMVKRKLQESLEDFELWDKEEMESIKKQIQLMQENINMWEANGTVTDSDEEN